MKLFNNLFSNIYNLPLLVNTFRMTCRTLGTSFHCFFIHIPWTVIRFSSITEYEKLKQEKSKIKEDIQKEQIEKFKKDAGEGKNLDLFSSPVVREQTIGAQLGLGTSDVTEDDEIDIEEIDLDEQKELNSFQRFLKSQGLKQSKENQEKT